MRTSIVLMGCSQPSRLAPERAPMESRWGAWPALRRVGFPTALPRTGQAAWRSIRLSRLALASTLSQV